jgi:hypothetical protein
MQDLKHRRRTYSETIKNLNRYLKVLHRDLKSCTDFSRKAEMKRQTKEENLFLHDQECRDLLKFCESMKREMVLKNAKIEETSVKITELGRCRVTQLQNRLTRVLWKQKNLISELKRFDDRQNAEKSLLSQQLMSSKRFERLRQNKILLVGKLAKVAKALHEANNTAFCAENQLNVLSERVRSALLGDSGDATDQMAKSVLIAKLRTLKQNVGNQSLRECLNVETDYGEELRRKVRLVEDSSKIIDDKRKNMCTLLREESDACSNKCYLDLLIEVKNGLVVQLNDL